MANTLTAQKIYDKVVRHLRKQGRKALDESGEGCMYLAPNGDKCAVGALFRKGEYNLMMEGHGVVWLFDNSPPSFSNRLKPFENLILSLQKIHDKFYPESWEIHFQKVAGQFVLTYTPPKVKKS